MLGCILHSCALPFVALAFLAAPLGPAAHADTPRGPTPLALTISGGGTKGATMAGHLYYLGQASQLARDALGAVPLQPMVFTGASAGAINALLGALTLCSAGTSRDPTASLYYQAWSGVGLRDAFRRADTRATGLLSTAPYAPILARLRALWDAGFAPSCDVLLGVSITRAHARMVLLAPNFPALPRAREAVLVRITGQGPGRPPLLRNVVDPARLDPAVLLPVDGPDADPFAALTQLVLASAAFPLAFAPVELAHCLSVPGTPTPCTPASAHKALFMDGGIFDNQPLGLALEAMRYVRRAEPTADPANPSDPASPAGALLIDDLPAPASAAVANARFYFLDPRARAYPSPNNGTRPAAPDGAVAVLGLLAGMIESSSANALLSVFEQRTELRDRLLVGRTYFPQIAGTFNGLIERAFREFDFTLGMINAARSLREFSGHADPLPDLGALRLQDPDPAVRAAWRPFACLRAVLDGVGDLSACAGDDLTDTRILLQLVLDQLADDCRAVAAASLPDAPPPTDHAQCAAAMSGAPAPHVPGVRVLPDAERQRRPGEDPLAFQLRLLGRYGFHFRDLGLARADAEEAPRRLVRLAHQMSQAFAEAQPSQGWALGIAGRIAVDLGLGYLPPQHSFHGILGLGAELGYSATGDDGHWDWLRFSLALGIDGLSTIFNASDDYLALAPKAGLEFELLGQAELQIHLGLRAGYQFSTADAFMTHTCHFGDESHQPCSRFVTEAFASASFLGFLRFQLAVVYAPGLRAGQDDLLAVRPMLGFQLNSPF